VFPDLYTLKPVKHIQYKQADKGRQKTSLSKSRLNQLSEIKIKPIFNLNNNKTMQVNTKVIHTIIKI